MLIFSLFAFTTCCTNFAVVVSPFHDDWEKNITEAEWREIDAACSQAHAPTRRVYPAFDADWEALFTETDWEEIDEMCAHPYAKGQSSAEDKAIEEVCTTFDDQGKENDMDVDYISEQKEQK